MRLDEPKVDLSFKVPDVCNEKLGLEGEYHRLKHDSGFKNGLIPFLKRVLVMAAMRCHNFRAFPEGNGENSR